MPGRGNSAESSRVESPRLERGQGKEYRAVCAEGSATAQQGGVLVTPDSRAACLSSIGRYIGMRPLLCHPACRKPGRGSWPCCTWPPGPNNKATVGYMELSGSKQMSATKVGWGSCPLPSFVLQGWWEDSWPCFIHFVVTFRDLFRRSSYVL